MSVTQKTVNIGDGVDRPIKYTMSYVRELKKKHGGFGGMLNIDSTEYLPQLIFDGLIDKAGFTPETIADEMDAGLVFRILTEVWTALSGNNLDFQALQDKATADLVKGIQPEKNEKNPTVH